MPIPPSGMDERQAELLDYTLECLLGYVRCRFPYRGGLFRTLADNWFAYSRGRPFLTELYEVRWLNTKDLLVNSEAAESFHFRSAAAMAVLKGKGHGEALVKDHSVPLKVLCKELLYLAPDTKAKVHEYLTDRYRLGLLTQAENARIREKGFSSAMPQTPWPNNFARYQLTDAPVPPCAETALRLAAEEQAGSVSV